MVLKISSFLTRGYFRLSRRPCNLLGASTGRGLYGIWLLTYYIQGFTSRNFIWGESAPNSPEVFLENLNLTNRFSLLAITDNNFYLGALVLLGALSALFVTLGLFTRASLIVSAVLLWSFHARNSFILDGGDNLGRIIVLFLIAMNCSEWLSLDRLMGRRLPCRMLENISHNSALLAITLQLCAVYLASGTRKLMGPLWQNGTAIYYVLRNFEFSRVGWVDLFTSNLYLIPATTYFVVALQCSFVVLVWGRKSRIALIGALFILHLGIAYFMGLVRFSLVMIATLSVLLPDEVWRLFGGGIASWLRNLRHILGASRRPQSAGSPQPRA